MTDPAIDFLCVGVCMADPESALCQGCGRLLLQAASTIQETVAAEASLSMTAQVTPAR